MTSSIWRRISIATAVSVSMNLWTDMLNCILRKPKSFFYATKDAGAKLATMTLKAKTLGYPLYLIIDEYDNFTNTVLNEKGEKVYWAMTHAEGFYRDIFKSLRVLSSVYSSRE